MGWGDVFGFDAQREEAWGPLKASGYILTLIGAAIIQGGTVAASLLGS